MALPIPPKPLIGPQNDRDRALKRFWVQALGGECSTCGIVYKFKRQKYVTSGGDVRWRYMPNLHVHYTGEDREGHINNRLCDIHVPSGNNPQMQRDYLEEFCAGLCPCRLECISCHGTIHGKESGEQHFSGCFNSIGTSCIVRQYGILAPFALIVFCNRLGIEFANLWYTAAYSPVASISTMTSLSLFVI
jgi:hypothetical protein